MAELSAGWATATLGELVDFYSGGTPSKKTPRYWDGDIPWFSAKDVKQPLLDDSIDHLAESVFTETRLRRLPKGTVVLVVRGMILAHTVPIAILDTTAGAINQDLKALTPKQGIDLDPRFLATMLRAQHDTILSLVSTAAHGTTKLESRVLEELRIPLPPIEKQRRIAGILDHVDDLRAKRRDSIVKLDGLVSSTLQTTVRTGVAPEIPVMDLVRDTSRLGAKIPRDSYEPTGTYPIIDQGNQAIAGYTSDRSSAYRGSLPVILFGDHTRVVKFTESDFAIGADGIKVLTPNPESDPTYIFHAIRDLRIPSAGYSRHFKFLRERSIPTPSVEMQRQFAERARAIDGQKDRYRAQLAELDRLFASLQARAFRGEL